MDDTTAARTKVLMCLDQTHAAWDLLVEDLYVLKRPEHFMSLSAYAEAGQAYAGELDDDLATLSGLLFIGVRLGYSKLSEATLHELDRVEPIGVIRDQMQKLVDLRPRLVAEWGLEGINTASD